MSTARKHAPTRVIGVEVDQTREVRPQRVTEQLSLFPEGGLGGVDYSRFLLFWSRLPIYYYGKQTVVPDVLQREFTFRRPGEKQKKTYTVLITPAQLTAEVDGGYTTVRRYPGVMEEMVMTALLQFLQEDSVKGDGHVGLRVSLRKIRAWLRDYGHDYRNDEIRQCLFVLRGTGITLIGGGYEEDFSPLAGVRFPRREDWCASPDKLGQVWFPVILGECIERKEWRLFNIKRNLSFGKPFSRWLHRRIVSDARHVKRGSIWSVWLTTILSEAGILDRARDRDKLKVVRVALRELERHRVLNGWTEKITRNGRVIENIQFLLDLHQDALDEIRAANSASGPQDPYDDESENLAKTTLRQLKESLKK